MDASGSPLAPAWCITPARGAQYEALGLVGVFGGGPPHLFCHALFRTLLTGGGPPTAALVIGTHPGTCAIVRSACSSGGRGSV